MNLVASMMVAAGELDRYLTVTLPALLEFCDEVCLCCEGRDEITHAAEYGPRVHTWGPAKPAFFANEGRARQAHLDWTLSWQPTHVLAIDADELVDDGKALRALLAAEPQLPVLRMQIEEVWRPDPDALRVREDGGWRSHPVPFVFRAPKRGDSRWRIPPRKLACGRAPPLLRQLPHSPHDGEISLLHFGWADESARAARHQRYVVADGGRFHRSAHLDSILWPDEKVTLRARPWPDGEAFVQLRERFAAVAA